MYAKCVFGVTNGGGYRFSGNKFKISKRESRQQLIFTNKQFQATSIRQFSVSHCETSNKRIKTTQNSIIQSFSPKSLILNSSQRFLTTETQSGSEQSHSTSQPLTKNQKLKQLFVKYGKIAVGVHIGLSLVSLGIWYALIANQVIDVQAVATSLGINVGDWVKSTPSSFGIAYLLHKASVPFRIPISLLCIPIVARFTNKSQTEEQQQQQPQ